MNFASRIMISLSDLQSTGLIGLGSRVTYHLLLAGSDKSIADYQQWANQYIETKKIRGLRIETLENAQPMMRKTLERAEQFLSLVALLTAMIAAVAIGLSARRYMIGQADACAALKCFGATRWAIIQKEFTTLLLLGMLSAVIGSAFGYLVQHVLTGLLGNLVVGNLPSVSIVPVLWSTVFAWVLLFAFAGPPLLNLANVSPMRLIRKGIGIATQATVWITLFTAVVCVGLIWVVAKDAKLALWVGMIFAGALMLFAILARFILWLLSKIQTSYFPIRFAITAMNRRAGFAVMQMSALAISIMAILLILLLRQDLLSTWQGNIPADAPNRFMINIQGDQREGIALALQQGGLSKPDFYPMIRGRLIAVNGRDIAPSDYSEENARRLVDREFNLSYTEQLPIANRIVAGGVDQRSKTTNFYGDGNCKDSQASVGRSADL
ncbi:ABC transporter permease [Polynucleobacter necessarius]|uniref:ABC transporter permease n=1 Tax=Polynucleobacter necessarius TaxID=576610 RepID=UPI0018D5974B|nr:FtsX-like permease family protein [Polynucleobacter necessarius]